MKNNTTQLLSIIIVSWNVRDYLEQCLQSIDQYVSGKLTYEVIVVDNNSSDDTVAMMTQKFPQMQIIANSFNAGFGKANNQALQQARGEYILFLNPDTQFVEDAVLPLIEFISSHPDCGLVGCQLLNADKTIQPSVRRFPTVAAILLLLFKIAKLFPDLRPLRHYCAADFDYSKTQKVDQIMGAFMLGQRELIKKLGGFDERFFIWFEEVDLCRRVYAAGYAVYYTPAARVIHFGGRSFAQAMTITKQWQFFKNACLYFIKQYRRI